MIAPTAIPERIVIQASGRKVMLVQSKDSMTLKPTMNVASVVPTRAAASERGIVFGDGPIPF